MTTFTPSEISLLRHRLEIPDAIAEVIADNESDELARLAVREPNMVALAAMRICGDMELGKSVERIVADLDALGRAVLTDAAEGSTYVACIDDDEVARRRAAVRAARSVTTKLQAAGLDVGAVPEL